MRVVALIALPAGQSSGCRGPAPRWVAADRTDDTLRDYQTDGHQQLVELFDTFIDHLVALDSLRPVME